MSTSTPAPTLRLYTEASSPHAQLALFILHLKRIPYTPLPMSFTHKAPELLAANPFGMVPTLLTPTLSLYESRAIARYLNELYPTPFPLIPATVEGRAVMEQWVSVEGQHFAVEMRNLCRERVWGPRFSGRQGDEAVVEKAVKALRKVLGVMERRLEESQWLAGGGDEGMTLADVLFVPLLEEVRETREGREVVFGEHPKVKAWFERMAQLDGWKEVQRIIQDGREETQKQIDEWRKKQKTDAAAKAAPEAETAAAK